MKLWHHAWAAGLVVPSLVGTSGVVVLQPWMDLSSCTTPLDTVDPHQRFVQVVAVVQDFECSHFAGTLESYQGLPLV